MLRPWSQGHDTQTGLASCIISPDRACASIIYRVQVGYLTVAAHPVVLEGKWRIWI